MNLMLSNFKPAFLVDVAIAYFYALVYVGHYYFGIDFIFVLSLDHTTHQQLLAGSWELATTAWRNLVISALGCLLAKFALDILLVDEFYFYVVSVFLSTGVFVLTLLEILQINRISATLKRILLGRIDTKLLRINDILVSDTFTSCSKVLLDVANHFSVMLVGTKIGLGIDIVILAVPHLIRLKQCWFEWRLGSKQAFYNLLKYGSNVLPLAMIFLSTGSKYLMGLEKFCILANSVYTFYWDVFVDWNYWLTIQSPHSSAIVWAIVFDFSLRFFWLWLYIFKTFYYFNEPSLFVMHLLEFTRRFVWCIFRLNSETLTNSGSIPV